MEPKNLHRLCLCRCELVYAESYKDYVGDDDEVNKESKNSDKENGNENENLNENENENVNSNGNGSDGCSEASDDLICIRCGYPCDFSNGVWYCPQQNKYHNVDCEKVLYCPRCYKTIQVPLASHSFDHRDLFNSALGGLIKSNFLLYCLIDNLMHIMKDGREHNRQTMPKRIIENEEYNIDKLTNSNQCMDSIKLLKINVKYHIDDMLKRLERLLDLYNREWVSCKSISQMYKILKIEEMFPEFKDEINQDNWVDILVSMW